MYAVAVYITSVTADRNSLLKIESYLYLVYLGPLNIADTNENNICTLSNSFWTHEVFATSKLNWQSHIRYSLMLVFYRIHVICIIDLAYYKRINLVWTRQKVSQSSKIKDLRVRINDLHRYAVGSWKMTTAWLVRTTAIIWRPLWSS